MFNKLFTIYNEYENVFGFFHISALIHLQQKQTTMAT